MFELGLDVAAILPTAGSWLEKEAPNFDAPCIPVASKSQLVGYLSTAEFDVFVSTGCKFILPISQLKSEKPEAVFVNVHPSRLPDLRGGDPIPGAILFRRDSGVTCHLMDDGIDTGRIIVSKAIPYFEGLDAQLLYRACFILEPKVFELALRQDFSPAFSDTASSTEPIYYSFREVDNQFHEADSAKKLVARARAFNTPSKGLRFKVGNQTFRAFGADQIPLALLDNLGSLPDFDRWSVALVVHNSVILCNGSHAVRLIGVDPLPDARIVGLAVRPEAVVKIR